MNVLSRYSFVSTYQAEKLTRQEAVQNGINSVDFSKCDTDGDGVITIEEILSNDDVCSKIIKAINAKLADTIAPAQESTIADNETEQTQLTLDA